MKKILLISLISIMVIFAGCTSLSDKMVGTIGLTKIDKVNQQIAQIKSDNKTALDNLQLQINQQNQIKSAAELDKEVQASNHVFNIQLTYSLIPDPSEYDQLINNEAKAASLFLPPPSLQNVELQLETIKKTLADKDNLAKNLAAQLDAAKSAAKVLADKQNAATVLIQNIQKQESDLATTSGQKIEALQKDKDQIATTALQRAQQLLDNKAAIDNFKKWAGIVLGGLCLLLIAAAVYSPVEKENSVVLAIIFGILAIGIQFIQPLYVGIAIAVCIFGIIVWLHGKNQSVAAAITSNGTVPMPTKANLSTLVWNATPDDPVPVSTTPVAPVVAPIVTSSTPPVTTVVK